MKLLIGAGGTGGHIIPAIAIAREFTAQGWQVGFIGNHDGMEKAIVSNHGFPFFPINVQKIYRKLTLAHLRFPYLFIKSLWACLSYIKAFKPDAILCTGGFVSGPVALAAVLSGKKLYFQDGNSYPGLTTRLMARFTAHIFTATEAATKYLRKADCVLTGNPILPYMKLDKSTVDWEALNLNASTTKLFVIGGSQGSAVINNAVGQCLDSLLAAGIEIIWQTGKNHKSGILNKFGKMKGIHIFDFTDKMSFYYQIADLAISRAGALSIAELNEHKIPAVYIPLPIAAENHQYINALAQEKEGKALVLEQSRLNQASLTIALYSLRDKYDTYLHNLDKTPENQATREICTIIIRETITQG